MKKLFIFIIVVIGMLSIGCHDITVGYLSTENASYEPDTMVVRHVLHADSIKNPTWNTYLNIMISTGIWRILGYDSPEAGVKGIYKITEWEYEEDYDRKRLDIHWLSTKLQGVTGTQPRFVTIKGATSEKGDANAMLQLLEVRGDGMFSLPTDVTSIPVGRYVISLNVYNEGYSKDIDNCFTIIVE